jgi:two-component system sensor histidine kinase YesM
MFSKFKMQTGFVLVFSSLLIFITLMIYIYINNYILGSYKNVMLSNAKQLNSKISQQLDFYYNNMNQMSLNSVSNRNLVDHMKALNVMPHELSLYERLSFDRDFEGYSSYLINFTSLNTSNVYIFGSQDRYKFFYGSLPLKSDFEQIIGQKSYQDELASNRKLIYFNNENTVRDGRLPSISIIRPFEELSGEVLGYIEIQQNYSMLEQIANLGTDGEVFIMDNIGQVLYPTSKLDEHTLSTIRKAIRNDDEGLKQNSFFYTSYTSSTTGYTTVVKHANEAVFQPLYALQNTTMVIFVTIMVVSILVIYLVTRRMTESIRQLRSSILKINFDNFSLFTSQKSSVNEVNLFNHAFQHMMERLKSSMEIELISKRNELKARFSALQAQISPHFLHNTLYLISISAEESKNQDVIDMCKSLSDMMRYTAASSFQQVTLEEEMQYTLNYLSLIEKKYEDFIFVEIEVEEEAKEIMLPRITIQPFIENTIQHAFNHCDLPWKIFIACRVSGAEWEIEIRDNGSGLDAESQKKMNQEIEEILKDPRSAKDNNFEVGGMGILNTVTRLHMMYPTTFTIQIENGEKCGVTIRLKASIYADR